MLMRRRLLKKLCQLGPRGAVEHDGRYADRDLVPGRSQGRPKGNPRLYLGADRIPAADGARQPPHLRLSVRRDLPGARRRRRDDRASRQYRSDEPALAGNQHAGCPGGARRPDLRRGGMASAGQAAGGTGQSHPALPAALQSRAEPDGKRLGLSASKQALRPGLGYLRRHRRSLQTGLELPDRRSRTHTLHRQPGVGVCHSLSGLVLAQGVLTVTDQADQPDTRPISPLRQRMLEDMAMHGLRDATQRDYLRFVRNFAAFLRRPPDTATPEDIRRFQVFQAESGVQPPTINCSVSALRFFFTVTLDRPDLSRRLVLVRHPRRLPTVLSGKEVGQLLEAAPGPKYRAALGTA